MGDDWWLQGVWRRPWGATVLPALVGRRNSAGETPTEGSFAARTSQRICAPLRQPPRTRCIHCCSRCDPPPAAMIGGYAAVAAATTAVADSVCPWGRVPLPRLVQRAVCRLALPPAGAHLRSHRGHTHVQNLCPGRCARQGCGDSEESWAGGQGTHDCARVCHGS